MRCEWCGKEHTTTADVAIVLIVGGVDGVVCKKCKQDFDDEVADEAEYAQSQLDDEAGGIYNECVNDYWNDPANGGPFAGV